MSAIEACRTEALGGHVATCARCDHMHIAYNSCKNRGALPEVPGTGGARLDGREGRGLLPVEYFHVVFNLPAETRQVAYWNKKAVYDLLFKFDLSPGIRAIASWNLSPWIDEEEDQ